MGYTMFFPVIIMSYSIVSVTDVQQRRLNLQLLKSPHFSLHGSVGGTGAFSRLESAIDRSVKPHRLLQKAVGVQTVATARVGTALTSLLAASVGTPWRHLGGTQVHLITPPGAVGI